MPPISIRLATQADLPVINSMYNHYVLHSTCTYQEIPETARDRLDWFASHDPEKHPITVATMDGEDEEVVGWGSLSPFHKRSAYRRTVESSVYVAPTHHRLGIGRAIMIDLIARARAAGHHTILAGADAEQTPSIALHHALGFTDVAFFREVGFKFDRWLHVRYMQLML